MGDDPYTRLESRAKIVNVSNVQAVGFVFDNRAEDWTPHRDESVRVPEIERCSRLDFFPRVRPTALRRLDSDLRC